MRLRSLALTAIVVAAAASGCVKDEEAEQTNAILPGTLAGLVTDAGLNPLAAVNVSVEGTNLTTLTDAAGAFTFELLPAEYVVLASHGDYKTGALRANVLPAQTSTLMFTLEIIPRITPRIEVTEAEGYLACEAIALVGEDRHEVPCGGSDPNSQPSVAFPVSTSEGLEAVVLELVWEARTNGATALRVEASLEVGDEVVPLGGTEGPSPLALSIPGRLVDGGTLVLTAMPAGGFTDEEAGLDGGVVLQQPFTSYASFFYYAPPPGAYSALQPPDA